MTILMMNKLHPLSFARKWVLSVGTVMTAGVCVGITITIKFGKQAGTSDCPGGTYIGIVSKAGHVPPLTVLLRSLQRQIVLSEPL